MTGCKHSCVLSALHQQVKVAHPGRKRQCRMLQLGAECSEEDCQLLVSVHRRLQGGDVFESPMQEAHCRQLEFVIVVESLE